MTEISHHQSPSDVTVVVAILSYKRPKMLSFLISRCREMVIPAGVKPIFLVVDNDPDATARKVADGNFGGPLDLRYILEPRRGIPMARNRALDEALALDADALCFIDDDEYPDATWLDSIVRCWLDEGADLVGGPVVVGPPSAEANTWQRFVNASLSARMHRKNRKSDTAAKSKGRFTILTNNWLCDLAWQKRSAIRFREEFRVSGGSDTAFYRDAKSAGCKAIWCSNAIVFETISLNRLSLQYQFRRAAAQSLNHFGMKHSKVSVRTVMLVLVTASVRFILGAALLVVPLYGMASPVSAVRSLGWSVGRLGALFGNRSELYK